MDKTEEGHQPRSRIGLCSCVCGETGGALPEPYRMTSSGLIVHISDQTVRNRLRETGMKDWSPLVGPVLTAHHRAAWLAYAKECKNWQYPPLIPCWLHRWKQVRSDNESKSLETPWETLWCLKHHPALQVFAWVSDDLILILARSYRPAYTDCCLVPGGNPQNFCQTLCRSTLLSCVQRAFKAVIHWLALILPGQGWWFWLQLMSLHHFVCNKL